MTHASTLRPPPAKKSANSGERAESSALGGYMRGPAIVKARGGRPRRVCQSLGRAGRSWLRTSTTELELGGLTSLCSVVPAVNCAITLYEVDRPEGNVSDVEWDKASARYSRDGGREKEDRGEDSKFPPLYTRSMFAPLFVLCQPLRAAFPLHLPCRNHQPRIPPCLRTRLSLHFPADSRPSVPDGVTCATPLPGHLSSPPPSSSSDNASTRRSGIAPGPTETTSKRNAEHRKKRQHAEAGPSSTLDEKENHPSIPAYATSRPLMRCTPYPSAAAITYTAAQDVSGVLDCPQIEDQQTRRERQRRDSAVHER